MGRVLANFTPGHQDTYVNFRNEDRAPLLFIAGGEDNLMPPAVNQSNAKHYRYTNSVTDYKEFEGRSHYTVGQDGWEEVADYALEWAVDHAKHPAGLITPSRSTGGGVQPMETHPAVRPFRIDVPEEDLDDLRRRIAAARWPTKELVEDRSQGVQLATMQELARYWQTDYDWRKVEEKLNALPQFTTEIDGVDIHFIHVRSQHEDALPLIMTHGWPGSVIELLETDRPAHRPDRARRTCRGRVRPRAAVPARLRILQRARRAWLGRRPHRAGLGRTDAPPRLHPLRRPGWRRGRPRLRRDGTAGTRGAARHPPQLAPGGAGHLRPAAGRIREGTRRARGVQDVPGTSGFGYFLEMATRPQTIGYALLDSPVALAAWLLDHDTDSYYKISRAFVDGEPVGNLTRETIVDNITLYWLTGTGVSAARSYWEDGRALAAAQASGQAPPEVSVPVGFTTFPGEIWRTPRSWVDAVYPNVSYFNEVDRGGHFAAWEEPELFSEEVRAAFRSLR